MTNDEHTPFPPINAVLPEADCGECRHHQQPSCRGLNCPHEVLHTDASGLRRPIHTLKYFEPRLGEGPEDDRFLSVGQRSGVSELTRAGLAKARAGGTALGRPPKTSEEQNTTIRAKFGLGASKSELAREFGISRATVGAIVGDTCGPAPATKATNPWDVQVGGGHYKDFAIQPAEFCAANDIGFLPGNVIKYVCRFDKKNGLEDLEKARHYVELMIAFHKAKQAA